MQFEMLLREMKENAQRIVTLVDGVNTDQARWKPTPGEWSILEVINHLYDEEREDFRVRLNIILHEPDSPWPPIDPQGWVVSRGYNERDLAESLKGFVRERQTSISWLEGLVRPDWNADVTTSFGSIKAGDMFAAWVSHDLLHMRQLVELHRDYVVKQAEPFEVRYAGEW